MAIKYLCFLLFLFSMPGCSNDAVEEIQAANTPVPLVEPTRLFELETGFYYWNDSGLQSFSAFHELPYKEAALKDTKVHIASLLWNSEQLYLVVNRFGLLDISEGRTLRHALFREKAFIQGFAHSGQLLLHFSENEQDMVVKTGNLLSLQGNSFMPVFTDFQKNNREFQIIDLVSHGTELAVAYKAILDSKSYYRFAAVSSEGQELSLLSQDAYLKAYSVKSFPKVWQRLFNDLYFSDVAIFSTITSDDGVEYWQYGDPRIVKHADNIFQLRGGQSDSASWLLMENSLFIYEQGKMHEERLPVLPAGFAYTQAYVNNKKILLNWVQRDFPKVAHSGILNLERHGN